MSCRRRDSVSGVTHIIDWRKDGVATVRWCGAKFLSDPVVLKKGETKLCPVCAIELRYDRQKKEVVEGGFPKLGGQMNVCEAKARIAKLEDALRKARPLLQDIMDIHRDPSDGEYRGCDTDPCAWCTEAKELVEKPSE